MARLGKKSGLTSEYMSYCLFWKLRILGNHYSTHACWIRGENNLALASHIMRTRGMFNCKIVGSQLFAACLSHIWPFLTYSYPLSCGHLVSM